MTKKVFDTRDELEAAISQAKANGVKHAKGFLVDGHYVVAGSLERGIGIAFRAGLLKLEAKELQSEEEIILSVDSLSEAARERLAKKLNGGKKKGGAA
jgi:hypothetical protein